MGASMATKLVLLLVVLFIISCTLAFQNASADEETYGEGFPSRNISDGDQRILGERKVRLRGPRRQRLEAGKADAVVAQDGSGDFRTIKEALDASVERRGRGRFVIHIKRGIYSEYVVVSEDMKNVMLVGDGIGQTVITGSNSVSQGKMTTCASATVVVSGDGFVARDITFQNTAGSRSHQAPAITSNAPHSVFFRCGFDGYQDTIFAQRGLQFYKECDIYGTVDFICGDAAVVIQNSNIYVRKSSTGDEITIAASHRDSPNSPTGIVFHNCRIMAAPDLKPVIGSYKIYLGRPWRPYARTVYIQSDIDVPVEPQGWLEWEGGPRSAMNTVDYEEYGNRGVGSSTGRRVNWAGYRVITDPNEVNQFTVANFIQGNTWLPATGVPFIPDL